MSAGDPRQTGIKHRLLIVDDEPDITRLIETAALGLGLEVMAINHTRDFEKALAALRPTVILLDVSMPGRDGLELINYLSESNYPGKVAVMSGTDPRYLKMSSEIAKARGLQLAGTLVKPFRMQDVKDLLTTIAGGSG